MVTVHNLYLLSAVGSVLSGVIWACVYYYYRGRRSFSREVSWEKLVQELSWIGRDRIAQAALDVTSQSVEPREAKDAASLEPLQLWELIGGLKGLEVLERNTEVLIRLAWYVQRRYPEALVVAEQLRLDARALKWHVDRLKGAARTGNLQISFPFYAQRAVVIYYRMTRCLLDLYEVGNFSMLEDLQRAL